MALSRDNKEEAVADAANLLNSSKLTVFARYGGTSVKSMQQLRKEGKEGETEIRVIKNRLFKRALASDSRFKDVDLDVLKGQLLYAFNAQDEVAPAQSIARFAKVEQQIEFVGAITADGQLLQPDDVKALASLPGKDQLRAQLVGTIAAPVGGFVNILAANIRGVMNVLNARVNKLS